MSDMAMIRIGILIAGLLLVAAIFLFGRPKKSPQGRRVDKGEGQPRERREPVISSEFGAEGDAAERAEGVEQSELNLEGQDASGGNEVGKRPNQDFDKIVSLFVAAKAGSAARRRCGGGGREDRAGVRPHERVPPPGGRPSGTRADLQHGQHPQARQFRHGQHPRDADTGDCVFPHLAGADDGAGRLGKMLPTVQRMAELLDGVVLDDSRNALGRQRVAHIRDELRAYDRQHQAPPLTKSPRW